MRGNHIAALVVDSARYRLIRDLVVGSKWSDLGPLGDLRLDPDNPATKYVTASDFDAATLKPPSPSQTPGSP